MIRLALLLSVCLPCAAWAQSTTGPRIDLNAAGGMGQPGSGEGSASVSGNITLPPGWQLSIHTLTIRYAKEGGGTTLNALLPLKSNGSTAFSASLGIKSGSYKIWAVIDVKDADGHERQISSDPRSVTVQ
jgi:hypothetical protein